MSNYGRIRNGSGYILVSTPHHQSGYIQTRLIDDDGEKRTVINHKMLALAFIGNGYKDRLCIDHIDRDRSNNHISNLRFVTPLENNMNKDFNYHIKPFLKEFEVVDICKKLEKGMSISQIVRTNEERYTKSRVESIKQKRRWVRISKDFNI